MRLQKLVQNMTSAVIIGSMVTMTGVPSAFAENAGNEGIEALADGTGTAGTAGIEALAEATETAGTAGIEALADGTETAGTTGNTTDSAEAEEAAVGIFDGLEEYTPTDNVAVLFGEEDLLSGSPAGQSTGEEESTAVNPETDAASETTAAEIPEAKKTVKTEQVVVDEAAGDEASAENAADNEAVPAEVSTAQETGAADTSAVQETGTADTSAVQETGSEDTSAAQETGSEDTLAAQEIGSVDTAAAQETGSEEASAEEVYDIDGAASESDAIAANTFVFSDAGITAGSGSAGYEIDGTVLNITAAGSYTVTGSCAEGSVVVAKGVSGVTLTLNNLTLSASATAPVVIKKNASVNLVLSGTSTLSDNESLANEENEDFEGAAIKVKSGSSLTISGSGVLNVNGTCKNGIKGAATASVNVVSGTVVINSANNGLASDGSVNISGGSLAITAGNEAVKSEPEEDDTESAGTVTISGGSISINSTDDAVWAANALTVSGGSFEINAGDDAFHCEYTTTIGAEGAEGPVINVAACNEGIEGAIVNLLSGSASLTCTDDGLNAANADLGTYAFAINVKGGTWIVNAGGDALDSNGDVTISGGTVELYGSANDGNSALDYDGTCTLSGGSLLAVGMSGMAQMPTGCQSLVFNNASVQAGTTIEMKDASGNTVYTAAGRKRANSIIFASAGLTQGAAYTLYLNGTQTASATAGQAGAFGPGQMQPGTQPTQPGQIQPGTQPTQPGQMQPGTQPGQMQPGTQPAQPGQTQPGTQPAQPGQTEPGTHPVIPDEGQQPDQGSEQSSQEENPAQEAQPSEQAEILLPAVTNLRAAAAGMNKNRITWDAVDGADGYLVLRNGTQIGYTTGATVYTDAEASADAFSYYWVIPYDKTENGIAVGETGGYTWALARTLGQVQKVSTKTTDTGVALSWDAVEGANGYVILSKSGSASAAFNAPVKTEGTSWVDSTADGVQFYWVYATYTNAEGKTLAAGQVSPYAWAVK